MRIEPLDITDVLLVTPTVYKDVRGEFTELWSEQRFSALGLPLRFVQDNLSVSRRFALRGLHYQIAHAQGKLVRVLAGEIFDVAVDLRKSSPTFGEWVAARLDAQSHQALWIPPGFAHGFLALAEGTRVLYKVTDIWAPQAERTLIWDDATADIKWPLPAGQQPILSTKDAQGSNLATADVYP